MESFKLIDTNGDGTVTIQELTEFLSTFGEKLTKEEVRKVVGKYDKDGSGTLNYQEFYRALTSGGGF